MLTITPVGLQQSSEVETTRSETTARRVERDTESAQLNQEHAGVNFNQIFAIQTSTMTPLHSPRLQYAQIGTIAGL